MMVALAMPALADATSLGGSAWRLAEFQSMSDKIGSLKPSGPLAVQVRFRDDGQATMKLDCNRGHSTWSAEPSADASNGRIAFGPIASTRALCPGPSLGEKFAADAPMIRGYIIRDGRLSLSLMADAGIYIFDPIPPRTGVKDGGPRVWTVTDAPSGLNLRSGPSTNAPVMSHFENGDRLDNLGCERSDGRLWCQVQRFGGGPVGYVAADYLSPSLGPDGSMPAGPDDSALRAGQRDFDATGKIRCGESQCDFGVARAGGGFATVVVTRRNRTDRAIYFRMGQATGADTSQADGYPDFSATRNGDSYIVNVGDERYWIPDAVIFGG